MTKGSDLLVAALENEGVDRIFGVPGEENLDVVESLRNSKIKLILTRHEQGAAFMAATYGRLTGKPGVCITTLGPGALNLTTGAAYALLGAMPMVMITGQKGIMKSRQAGFQIVDVVSAFKPLTKMSRQIVSSATIPTLVRDAFRIARGREIVYPHSPFCLRDRCGADFASLRVAYRGIGWSSSCARSVVCRSPRSTASPGSFILSRFICCAGGALWP